MMAEDRVLSYLSGALDADARRAFEADLARDPALREELEAWRNLAEARQLAHNEIGQGERDAAFLRALAQGVEAAPAPASAESASASAPASAESARASSSEPASARAPVSSHAPVSRGRRLWQWLWPTPASPLMPLGWALAIMLSVVVMQQAPVQGPAVVLSDDVLTRGGASCPRLVVDLPDALTARQLRNTLSQYAVSIVDGPDADGRYVLAAARESSLRDAATALGALSITAAPAGACPKR
ncbi:hypothetical protein LMG26690_01705 [Achromobacter animicus]|uniref:Zinc-finger domain-containing protein n=1 Tax=Achromobacter animicus TaxID=1389935 RepID=A0A6S6ZM60_9BURK|nr:hypothetical protein [Achromobacter animicus]CAB3683034.1 hypothetical protein LMG26690_01705 [Achromobacter animicus]